MLKEMAAQKNVAEVRRLTQEELLKEAKVTEAENLQSLGNYRNPHLVYLYVEIFLLYNTIQYNTISFIYSRKESNNYNTSCSELLNLT